MNNDAARQEQLIKRIRKLLALSRNNSNPHEAAQALSRAQSADAEAWYHRTGC